MGTDLHIESGSISGNSKATIEGKRHGGIYRGIYLQYRVGIVCPVWKAIVTKGCQMKGISITISLKKIRDIAGK